MLNNALALWQVLVIITSVVLLGVNVARHITTKANARILLEYLSEEERLKIIERCKNEIWAWENDIVANSLSNWYNSAHYSRKLAGAKFVKSF